MGSGLREDGPIRRPPFIPVVSQCQGFTPLLEPTAEVGRKDDQGKLRYGLLPVVSIKEIVKVLTFGCEKYKENSWQNVENPVSRYKDALMRHIESWRDGELYDPESGIHHLGHAGCNILFLLWFSLAKNLNN